MNYVQKEGSNQMQWVIDDMNYKGSSYSLTPLMNGNEIFSIEGLDGNTVYIFTLEETDYGTWKWIVFSPDREYRWDYSTALSAVYDLNIIRR